MPAKKGNKAGGGGGDKAPPPAPTKAFDVDASFVFIDDKLEAFLAAVLPFLSKTKINKGIQGKLEKDSTQPQVAKVELYNDEGKKVQMKMPGKLIEGGMKFRVTISHPPKDMDAQLANGAAAITALEEEKQKLTGLVNETLQSVNKKIEDQKNAPPKNSWMHKKGGSRAAHTGGEEEAKIGNTGTTVEAAPEATE